MADHDAPQVVATADTVDFDDTGLSATADPALEPHAIGPAATWLVEVAPGYVIMDDDTPVTVVTLAYDLDDEITDFVVRYPDGRLVRITGAGDEFVTLADPTQHLGSAPAHAVVHGLDAWLAGGPDPDELAAADGRRPAAGDRPAPPTAACWPRSSAACATPGSPSASPGCRPDTPDLTPLI